MHFKLYFVIFFSFNTVCVCVYRYRYTYKNLMAFIFQFLEGASVYDHDLYVMCTLSSWTWH